THPLFSLPCDFPLGDSSRHDVKERMRVRLLPTLADSTAPCGIALSKLAREMLPLEGKLTRSDGDRFGSPNAPHLRGIEGIPTMKRLGTNPRQEGIGGPDRTALLANPKKLGVLSTPARPSEEPLPSEKPFPPRRSQAGWIKISRMDGPEPHC